MTDNRKPLPLPRGALDGCAVEDDAPVVDPATMAGEVVIGAPLPRVAISRAPRPRVTVPKWPASPPPLTLIVNGTRIPMRYSLPPDDASRAVRLIDEALNATETARGLLYATAAGRCRVMLAVQSVQAVVLDQVRAANGRPVDHCRHGWHRGTHVHTGRR